MKQRAHVNPKSSAWVLSLVVMMALSAAVVLASDAIYETANKKYTKPVEIGFTIDATEKLELSDADGAGYGVIGTEAAYDRSGGLVAYVVKAAATGYNAESPIELAVTISADGALVCGIDVLSQKETEYLGERIAADAFKGQFTGRYLPVVAAGDTAKGSPIDVISKATISSKAVIDAVNRAREFVLAHYPRAAGE